jgi:HD-GYP domain-containing protein (c-di-GMP phosphodiesterase class II)
MNRNQSCIEEFIRHLLSAVANASLYGMEHPQVVRLSSQACSGILQVLSDRSDFSLLVVDDELIVDGQPIDSGLFLGRFVRILKTNGISHLKIMAGVSQQEIHNLIAGLALRGEKTAGTVSSDHIRLGHVEIRVGSSSFLPNGNAAGSVQQVDIQQLPHDELEKFKEIYEAIKRQQKLKITGVFEIVAGFVNVFRQEGRPLLAMATLRDTDEYTFTHSTNVCILNLAQAMALGIEGQLLNDIGVSAMLHDIGKLFVPEEVLTKQDKLTSVEFDVMKQHPVKGAHHLLGTSGVPRLAIVTAFEHHMKFDFSGYPAVPPGWQQNICSHMTTISDFFDALRTRRPYRAPVELPKIVDMMLGMMGNELHPVLTRNFLKIISKLMESESTALSSSPP